MLIVGGARTLQVAPLAPLSVPCASSFYAIDANMQDGIGKATILRYGRDYIIALVLMSHKHFHAIATLKTRLFTPACSATECLIHHISIIRKFANGLSRSSAKTLFILLLSSRPGYARV